MKNPHSHRSRAAALVVVLALLVLITAMIVGFLSRAGTERRASAADRANTHLQILAEMPVNIVKAQIDTAIASGHPWASQPGAVRTFKNNGTLELAYKLYSAGNLTSDDGVTLRTEDQAPGSPADAEWTDLNEPADFQGSQRYPIMDPRIANDDTQAEGFSIAGGAEMRVRWLYVLKDGQTVAPTASGGNLNVPDASKTNPIVGRIAFWTDDETAKVNINTAGDGVFWDKPYGFFGQDWNYAMSQPAQNEFQRYPGHPATVSLQAVFPDLSGQNLLSALTPRYRWGGSQGGTVAVTGAQKVDLSAAKDRLFSSVDELAFKADRTQGILSRDAIDQHRFLLTANSRAPEINLFDLPRVAIWPLHVNDAKEYRTDVDRAIARASSLGKDASTIPPTPFPYYFQRNSPYVNNELTAIPRNETLYQYLQGLTSRAIPGFGSATFATKFGADRDQILTEIFDYIRGATNLADPLLTDPLLTPGGQPFTNKLDGTPNPPIAHGQVVPTVHGSTMGFGRYYTVSQVGLHFICSGVNSTVTANATAASNNATINLSLDSPLEDGERRVQAMFLFQLFSPVHGYTLLRANMEIAVSGLDNIKVNGNSIFPSDADGTTKIYATPGSFYNGKAWGGNPSIRLPLRYKYAPARGRISADPPTDVDPELYPFISNFFTVNGGSMNVSVTGPVTITISLRSGPLKTDSLVEVQTITLPTMAARATKVPELKFDESKNPNTLADWVGSTSWWTFSRTPVLTGGNPGRLYALKDNVSNSTTYNSFNGTVPNFYPTAGWFLAKDTVVSWLPAHGDYRHLAAKSAVPDSIFAPHPDWDGAHNFATTFYEAKPGIINRPEAYNLFSGTPYHSAINYTAQPPLFANTTRIDPNEGPSMPDYVGGEGNIDSGDWDTGISSGLDGPFINKPDEGTPWNNPSTADSTIIHHAPYFRMTTQTAKPAELSTFFSPTRQVPSPGMFGSLPTGIARGKKYWQTLLFRPQAGHPNDSNPPDYLLMDLFWMPVAEPYVISEPFSTAGKINMNYEILPFTNITRETGLYAALKGERIATLANNEADTYKSFNKYNTGQYDNPNGGFHDAIDVDETLQQFRNMFSDGKVFRSATEICSLWIVPQGESLSGMANFWKNHRLTGDNLRERIYTTLYPRLTTKSNTFTVHVRVQTLKASPLTPDGQWEESKGVITGEYRGSTLIERYINPNEPTIPDYAANPSATPALNTFYQWRTIASTRFAP